MRTREATAPQRAGGPARAQRHVHGLAQAAPGRRAVPAHGLRDAAARYHGGDEELLAAKVVGRWQDGAPLVTAPHSRAARTSTQRRRAPTTSATGDDPRARAARSARTSAARTRATRSASTAATASTFRHRIIRRGMPYGPPLPAERLEDDGAERGLVFVVLQREHLAPVRERPGAVAQRRQHLRPRPRLGLPARQRDRAAGKMTVQGDPPFFLAPQEQFVVTTRGGEYLFVARDHRARGDRRRRDRLTLMATRRVHARSDASPSSRGPRRPVVRPLSLAPARCAQSDRRSGKQRRWSRGPTTCARCWATTSTSRSRTTRRRWTAAHRAVHPRPRRHPALPPRPRRAARRDPDEDVPALARRDAAAARERVAAAGGRASTSSRARRPRHRRASCRATSARRARTPRRSCAGRATSSRTSSSTSATAPRSRERALADASRDARAPRRA